MGFHFPKAVLITFLLIATPGFSKDVQDEHSTIYTTKVKRIVNALNVGDYETQKSYMDMLATACKRNSCTAPENKGIEIVGKEIVMCRLKHLKAHGIVNSDAVAICENPQAQFACDSIATPLLRKMCYTGNNYSLAELQRREKKMKNRMPASVKGR